MMPVQIANVTCSNNGINTLITNLFETATEYGTHLQKRGAVIRVISYLIQNQSSSPCSASFQDSSGTVLIGPEIIPANPGNWTERASVPAYLFETTRNTSSPYLGYDLQLVTNTSSNVQATIQYQYSFVPGRPGV